MPKTIHTVILADGTEVSRESASRRYSHVVVVTFTSRHKDNEVATARARARRLTDVVLAAEAIQTPEDEARHAALLAEDAFLEEMVDTVDRNGLPRRVNRWLSTAFSAGKPGEGESFNNFGYVERQRVNHAMFDTMVAKLEQARSDLNKACYLVDEAEKIVVGSQRVAGWSMSAKGAEAMVQKERSHRPLCTVKARTDFVIRGRGE